MMNLEDYIALDDTSYGDYCHALLNMRTFNTSHGMSELFTSLLDTELANVLDNYKTHTKITNKETKITRKYKELTWI